MCGIHEWPPRELAVRYRLDPRARTQARKTLPGWGLGEHADIAELVVSELVTKAVVHGAGQIEVRLSSARAVTCGLRSTTESSGSSL